MSVTSIELEQVAQALMNNTEESFLRSSASRFYYSAWHFLHEKVDRENLPIPNYTGGVHQAFIGGLLSNTSSKRAGYILKTMRDIRVLADYKTQEDFAFSKAQEIQSHLNNLKTL